MRFLDYKLKNQNIAFHADIEPGLETPLAPHDLEEIFLNTMINSIQAMAEGGSLRVTGKHRQDKVHITVEDNGSGIAEANLERVFDLFYSTKKPDEGTGLGMWMTYELVKKYNGDITLESKEGIGTKITFIIPEKK
jgi:signal transduction histidine kinase